MSKINIKSFFNNKKFKYGGLSVLLTVLFIVGVILLNMIAGMLLERFDTTVDLTENKLYSIGDDSKKVLSALDSKVKITVLNDEVGFKESYNQANELLKQYIANSGNITVDYIDIVKNPTYAAQFGENLEADQVIVKSESTGRMKYLGFEDFIKYSTDEYGNATGIQYIAEQSITSAILSVSDKNPIRVAFTEGFNEEENKTFSSTLSNNGYGIEKINLALATTGNSEYHIDEDIDIIIINGPTIDYSIAALDILEKWLDNNGTFGKTLLYLSHPEQSESPNIDNFLKDWGLKVERALVYQSNGDYASPLNPYIHVGDLKDTDIGKSLADSKLQTIVAFSKAVTQLFEESSNMQTEVILSSYDGAILGDIEKLNDEKYKITEDKDAKKGAFPVFVMSQKTKFVDNEPQYSRIFAGGTLDLFHGTYLKEKSYNNVELLISTINYVSGKDTGIYITAKEYDQPLFEMSSAQAITISVIFVIVVPLLVIVVGVVIWLRRRHR